MTSNLKSTQGQEELLLQLLLKELGYYQVILDITRQENAKFLAHQPLEEIIALVKKKKLLLSCIQDIDNALLPIKQDWQNNQFKNAAFTSQINETITCLNQQLIQILEIDRANELAMQEHLRLLKTQNLKPLNSLL